MGLGGATTSLKTYKRRGIKAEPSENGPAANQNKLDKGKEKAKLDSTEVGDDKA